jgi:hypothetical protein
LLILNKVVGKPVIDAESNFEVIHNFNLPWQQLQTRAQGEHHKACSNNPPK